MVSRYNIPSESFPLRQGEVLCNLIEITPATSEIEDLSNETKTVPVYQTHYPFAITVSQDCDLTWDWNARNQHEQDNSKLLTHIQFCELFQESEIRTPGRFDSQLWKRVSQNQDERYHHFDEAPIGESGEDSLPHLYADFKRTFSLPVDYTYWLISTGNSTRKAVLANPYLLDFIHRLHGFLSRVPLPEQ